jgi:hypothetical protein
MGRGRGKSSAVTFRARMRGKYITRGCPVPQFVRSQRVERGARPCGATVRGWVPRASLQRNPKEVVDCLKIVVSVHFHSEGKELEVISADGELR